MFIGVTYATKIINFLLLKQTNGILYSYTKVFKNANLIYRT